MAASLTDALADAIVADTAAGNIQQAGHVEQPNGIGPPTYLITVQYHDGNSIVVTADLDGAQRLLERVRDAHVVAEAAKIQKPEVKNRCDACALWAPLFLVQCRAVCAECKAEFDAEGYLMFMDNETGAMVTLEAEGTQ